MVERKRKATIHVASVYSQHRRWRVYRDQYGWNIISHWPDDAGKRMPITKEYLEQQIADATSADVTIVLRRESDPAVVGAVEMGAALAANKIVIITGDTKFDSNWIMHPKVYREPDEQAAFKLAEAIGVK